MSLLSTPTSPTLLTISTAAAPEHFEGQLPALGTQIPEGRKRMDRSGKEHSKQSPRASQRLETDLMWVNKIALGLQIVHLPGTMDAAMSGNYFPQLGVHIPNSLPPDVYLGLELPSVLFWFLFCFSVSSQCQEDSHILLQGYFLLLCTNLNWQICPIFPMCLCFRPVIHPEVGLYLLLVCVPIHSVEVHATGY